MRLGPPVDAAQWLALAAAAAVLAAGPRLVRKRVGSVRFVVLVAAVSAALSAAYVVAYLRGGPRIIDATSYWLEARAIARGMLSWPVPEPAASTLGRFLVAREAPDGLRAAVIFPPGFPAVLAVGFLLGAPMAVGPVLAAAIGAVTYALGARLERGEGSGLGGRSKGGEGADRSEGEGGGASIARTAALLSVACAALRYHTADTMAHGLAALCFASSLLFGVRALGAPASGEPEGPLGETTRPWLSALAAGAFAGWLVATRPASGAALLATLAFGTAAARGAGTTRRALGLALPFALGMAPGAVLLAAHQHAATGTLFASSQLAYYAASDGPPGCFRYGFGSGIGCLGEHGDFVRTNLPRGFDALATLGTTLRRLRLHLVDVLNAEPLAVFAAAGAVLALRRPRQSTPARRLLVLGIVLQVLAYVPFYFDGNYPGGGARMLADVLPLEHVLAALAAVRLGERLGRIAHPAAGALARRAASGVVALALVGFAFRAGFDHAALRDREGGVPMFEARGLAAAGIDRGLVLVDTDHGFDLAFLPPAPGSPAAEHEPVAVARLRGDALDRMVWESLGRPPAYRYVFRIPEGGGRAHTGVEPYDVARTRTDVVEGESLWPARFQARAFGLPEHTGAACASGGRVLRAYAAPATDRATSEGPPGAIAVTLRLPAAWIAGRDAAPVVLRSDDACGELRLDVDGRATQVWRLSRDASRAVPGAAAELRCERLSPAPVDAGARDVALVLSPCAAGATFALDRVERTEPGENR